MYQKKIFKGGGGFFFVFYTVHHSNAAFSESALASLETVTEEFTILFFCNPATCSNFFKATKCWAVWNTSWLNLPLALSCNHDPSVKLDETAYYNSSNGQRLKAFITVYFVSGFLTLKIFPLAAELFCMHNSKTFVFIFIKSGILYFLFLYLSMT